MNASTLKELSKNNERITNTMLSDLIDEQNYQYESEHTDIETADNAITLLKAQHREFEDLFERVEKASYADGMALFRELADKLQLHMEIEENFFYPLATKTCEPPVSILEEDHDKAKGLIANLLSISLSEDHFKRRIRDLKETMVWHIHDEETNLFPAYLRSFNHRLLSAIADQMRDYILLRGMEEVEKNEEFSPSDMKLSYGFGL